MVRVTLTRWLHEPPLSGGWALLAGIAAFAVPTLIRAAVSGEISGCEFSVFVPFVFVAGLLLRWWKAILVSLASVAVMGDLVSGPQTFLQSECFRTSAALFLAESALMIGLAVLLRRVVSGLLHRGADERGGEVVFSLKDGKVWASWYDSGPSVRLGSHEKVEAMMEDFLAQQQVAKRLNERSH